MDFLNTTSRIKKRRKYLLQVLLWGLPVLLIIALGVIYLITNELKSDNSSTKDTKVASLNICLGYTLPDSIKSKINSAKFENYKDEYIIQIDGEGGCNVDIMRNPLDVSEFVSISSRLYVPIMRFDSAIDEIQTEDLAENIATQSYLGHPIIWDQELGDPFLESRYNSTIGQEYTDIATVLKAVEANNNLIAIVPFEYLNLKYKVLKINGETPLDISTLSTAYPLTDTIWLRSENEKLGKELSLLIKPQFISNYDKALVGTVLLSGKSTIGANQYKSTTDNKLDLNYPLRGVGQLFINSDVAHLSNSTSFWEGCTQSATTSVLCGSYEYVETIQFLQPEVLGLTGDNLLDYGRPVFETTINKYKELNLQYYGAGLNTADAQKIVKQDLSSLKLGFTGFTYTLPSKYLAGKNFSGHSGATTTELASLITKASTAVDYLFVELQAGESNTDKHNSTQSELSQIATTNGADIVFGVHSDKPQGIEITTDKAIFYSLGTTFAGVAEREGILVNNIFYNNKYIGFELIPIYVNNSLQTVLAQDERKARILQTIYSDSSIK